MTEDLVFQIPQNMDIIKLHFFVKFTTNTGQPINYEIVDNNANIITYTWFDTTTAPNLFLPQIPEPETYEIKIKELPKVEIKDKKPEKSKYWDV